ncbi:AAA family ATPase [uncultured virus]|nr:AAA family ATPase [uncultured virus]
MYSVPRAIPSDSIDGANVSFPMIIPLNNNPNNNLNAYVKPVIPERVLITLPESIPDKTQLDILITKIENGIRNGTLPSTVNDPARLLDSLIGLQALTGSDSVKDTVANQVSHLIAHGSADYPLHTVISGSNGRDKRVLTGILSRIWSSIGIIPPTQPAVQVIRRKDLVRQYLGHTELQTQNLLRSAASKVIFIDEAYSLNNGNHDIYGQEAIHAINQYLDERPNQVIVMDSMPSNEPGLRRRFRWNLNVNDIINESEQDSSFDYKINESEQDSSFDYNRINEPEQDSSIGYDISFN